MIQIKNRVTGLYDIKGHCGVQCWTDKMHKRGAWGCISHAKAHVTQCLSGYDLYQDNILNYIDSDFIIINEDYSITTEPILTHILIKLKEYVEKYKEKDWIDQQNINFCEELIEKYS